MLTRPRGCLCQQRRLSDAGFAAHHDRAAFRSGAIDQILDERNFPLAPIQATGGLPLDHPAASLCRVAVTGIAAPGLTRVPGRSISLALIGIYLAKRFTNASAVSAT